MPAVRRSQGSRPSLLTAAPPRLIQAEPRTAVGGPAMPQSVACLHVHIVFSTRGREPFLSADLAPRVYEYFGGIARSRRSVLVAAGGMPDHVHLLVSLGK